MDGDTALILSLIVTVVGFLGLAIGTADELKKVKKEIKELSEDLQSFKDVSKDIFETLAHRLENHFKMHEKTMSLLKEYDIIVMTQDKRLDTVVKQLNAVSEALDGKQKKTTFSIDEVIAKLPKTKKKPTKKTKVK